MSEYQYSAFQTIDHALTPEAMVEWRRYSTRAKITLTRFCNEYNRGDFKGDPRSGWSAISTLPQSAFRARG